MPIPQVKCSVEESYLARLAPGSRPAMRSALRRIRETYGKGDIPGGAWSALRYEDTMSLRTALIADYAPTTANRMLAALRGVMTEAWRLHQLSADDLKRALDIPPIPGGPKNTGRTLSETEVEMLTASTSDPLLIRFMVATGARCQEAATLGGSWTWPPNTVILNGKGSKTRQVPISAGLALALRERSDRSALELAEGSVRLFPRPADVIRDAARVAGLGRVTPHDLRRTFCTRLLSAGIDLATVQKLMGHASPRTTVLYDRRSFEETRAAVVRVFE